MSRPEDWPEILRPVVGWYGAERTWFVGLDLFGYPPTWVSTAMEAKDLMVELFKRRMSS